MVKQFLRAKHWQLFIPVFVIPMILEFMMVGKMISNSFKYAAYAYQPMPDTGMWVQWANYFVAMQILMLVTYFGWYWSVVIGLKAKVPATVRLKIKQFKVFFFIGFSYLIVFSILIGLFIHSLNWDGYVVTPSAAMVATVLILVFLLYFFSLFCMFYSVYYAAKVFKAAELKREVTFSDFAAEFFLILFFPIGVWILQPKINKLLNADSDVKPQ